MADSSCFSDRVVLITGAGGVLGSASALAFSRGGASLALMDIQEDKLSAIRRKLVETNHPNDKLLTLVGDVRSDTDVETLVSLVIARFTKVNHLINIVGDKRMGDILKVTLDDLNVCLDTNVKGTLRVVKTCLPYLIETKGTVVNMSSMAALKVFDLALPYGTAKAALGQMTRTMAAGVARKGVRINAVCPASVIDPNAIAIMGHLTTREQVKQYTELSRRNIPLGRPAVPREIIATVLFLSSDASGFITGAELPVEGAYALTVAGPST